MTRQQQLEEIRAKCIEANPEIVELKFGCLVTVHLSFRDQGGIITRWLDTSKTMPQWVEWPYPVSGRVDEYCTNKSKMTIIGRSIRLADVLLAMKSEEDRIFERQIDLIRGHKDDTRWNLRKDSLDEQSDETISFLHSLLSL